MKSAPEASQEQDDCGAQQTDGARRHDHDYIYGLMIRVPIHHQSAELHKHPAHE